MNAKLRQEISKALDLDPEMLKQGKWVPLGNTGLSFLVRPATIHNKDFQAKLLQDENYKLFDKVRADPEAFKDEALRLKYAEILLGTIILDIKKQGLSKEDLGVFEADDLSWLMLIHETDFSIILNHTTNRKNFQIITDEQAKN